MTELKPGEHIEDLMRNGRRIIQNERGFRFGMDAVLLSGFAKVMRGETVVDLCTGSGIIPILLEAKTKGSYFVGVEIHEEIADMARRSVSLNGQSDRIGIVTGDIRGIPGERAGSDGGLLREYIGKTDVVTANPPYMKAGSGLVSPDPLLASARHETKCTLEDVCFAAAGLLRSAGRFYLVHRPMRLSEIIVCLRAASLEPKRIKPVYPFAGRDANMVLIESVRDAGPGLSMESPLVIYKEPGVYTDEIYDIYGY